jgi:protein TonB
MMAANSFLETKPASPLSFGAVLLLHGAAIAGVLLIKNQEWIREQASPTVIYDIPLKEPPPVEVPPERPVPDVPSVSRIDVVPPVVDTPLQDRPVTDSTPTPPTTTFTPDIGRDTGTGTTPAADPPAADPPRADPVRVDAQFDPRFAGEMQPPYPAAEQRLEREGQVRIRVTVGANGRVLAAERVSATSDAFWRATERQALSRWRFRPATLDGRPVESSKVLTVHFRLSGR